MLRAALVALTVAVALPALAAEGFRFASIDGGTLALDDWLGRPVLVVNTASRCGFTSQYDGLQALYGRYRDRGLVVLAVPSDDFRQELATDAEVKDYCEVNFDLDLPMTTISHVRGETAHPLYHWFARHGFEPAWNFNKPDGTFIESWDSTTRPLSRPITSRIEALLD